MHARDHCKKALECARGKRFDHATQTYVFRHDEAVDHAREAVKQIHSRDDSEYFERQIDRSIEQIVEDPARAVERHLLTDNRLESRIRRSLEKPPIGDAILEMWEFYQARRNHAYPISSKKKRGGIFPLMRAFNTVIMRELNIFTPALNQSGEILC